MRPNSKVILSRLMKIRPETKSKAQVLVQKTEAILLRLMKVRPRNKAKAESLSKEAIASKMANCNQIKDKSKANALVQYAKTIHKKANEN